VVDDGRNMRIWSLHPRYLDRQGLTACWRETLLAQAVLAERTRGYRSHPQLERFRATTDPLGAICWYLHGLADEADARGYRYDRNRIDRAASAVAAVQVSDGQLDYEWSWLRRKLAVRSPEWLARWSDVDRPEPHRSFTACEGPIAAWERVQAS
jgi:hypothetical protein